MEIFGVYVPETTASGSTCDPSTCIYQCWCISGGPKYNSTVSCHDNINRF